MPAERTVHRRDLLLLRAGSAERCMDLSCQALYMLHIDLMRTQGGGAPVDQAHYEEPWLGEPPSVAASRSLGELFSELSRQLEDVDVLRVIDCTWIADESLTRELKKLVATVVTRGARVEFVPDESRL